MTTIGKKLVRAIKYLRHTRKMELTLTWDDSATIRIPVDVAFAVYPNMRSHACNIMTVGPGAFYASSTKQKLDTRSSTEAELVAV